MGRKSNSSSGDGSTTVATVMGLRMIQCGRQTVHVIQPDGQVRQFPVPVKVSDLVHLYPHHFVSPATSAPSTTTGRRSASSAILPLDTYLDTGSIYVLLPLPRLFPSAPPHAPHLCSCFLRSAAAAEEATGIGAIKAEILRHWPVGTSSSSKISPEDGTSAGAPAPRRLWEPPLEIIAEDRVLVFSKEDEAEKDWQNKGKKIVSTLQLKLRPSSTSSSSPSSSSSSSSSSS